MTLESEENSVRFTEAENKIRKRWLFWSTILPACLTGFFVILSVIGLVFHLFTEPLDFGMIFGVPCFIALSAAGLYTNYYCAYKNPGTILLLLMMIGIVLELVVNVLAVESKNVNPARALVLSLWESVVFYYSYKLRGINKKMREKRFLASPLYTHAVSVLSTATNLEELNEQFARLKQESSPNAEGTIAVLVRAYNQQKKSLKHP